MVYIVLTGKPGSPEGFPIIGPAFEVVPRLDLQISLRLATMWLTECSQKHTECNSTHSGRLPTRVLDLGKDNNGSIEVRLCETIPGQLDKYVALSYCWGKSGNITTTKKTLKGRRNGISWNLMPQSFRDAAEISRGLGIQYLWIDALCIIQDDASDWEHEAAIMAEVYENAFVTISIDSGFNPLEGIFITRDTSLISTIDTLSSSPSYRRKRSGAVEKLTLPDKGGKLQYTIHAREPIEHKDIILPRSYYDITYPLMTRAWALQERILSRRILHFTSAEMLWECKEKMFCECGSVAWFVNYATGSKTPKIDYEIAMKAIIDENKALNTSHSTTSPDFENMSPRTPRTTKEWTMLIGGYSNRQLTFESDKLPAISALARRFSLVHTLPLPRTYLAGLWLIDLPWLLCWRASGRRFEKRPDVYCGPTWSWVATKTPIIWDWRLYDAESKVHILRAVAEPQGRSNIFGQVKSASVTVCGCVQGAVVDFEVTHAAVLGLCNARGEEIFFVPDQNPDLALARTPQTSAQRVASSLQTGEDVFCLWVLHLLTGDEIYGLVLAIPSDESIRRSIPEYRPGKMPAVYERVGIITAMSQVYQKNEVSARSWFEGGQTQIITII